MSSSLSRLTLYVLISAIEQDIRGVLIKYCATKVAPAEFFGGELLSTVLKRAGDKDGDFSLLDLSRLIEYSDFGDLYSLLKKNMASLPSGYMEQMKPLAARMERLIATRNRVMHSRPLEFDDLVRTAELVEFLLHKSEYWPRLLTSSDGIRNSPESVLRVVLPPQPDYTRVLHNLPLADFDETGFIGRRQALDNLLKALKGPYPVITVVGEGGLGKTSIALKAAYEILDSPSCEFEAIIFVTAKATQLTANEITRIKGAINTSLGLVEAAVNVLGGDSGSPIEELKELLNEFKILLIIDNLETVVDNQLRDVLQDLPFGSKVLITTRIGLGAYEFPVQLQGLSDSEAVQLLRATAEVRGCQRLTRVGDDRLSVFCRRMRNNPLHIKWFVSAVQIGKRPEEVLADESMFLRFCLSNVFDQVGDNARAIVRALLALGGGYTVAELSYLTSIEEDALLKAVQELMRTNMFLMTSASLGGTYESRYELSQLARAYLSKFYPAGKDKQLELISLKNKLISSGEEFQKGAARNPLSPYTIHTRSRSDWVIARLLREALELSKQDAFDEALVILERAKILAPDFYECFRVEGWINALMGNASEAYASYERAIETEPSAANARMMFAGFLLREIKDSKGAYDQFKEVIRLSPQSHEPKVELARCCLFLGEYAEAISLLGELGSMTDCHERVKTKIVDLTIQLYCRMSDSYSVDQEPLKAVECLISLKAYYDGLDYADERMIRRVLGVKSVALHLRNILPVVSPKYQDCLDIIAWIDRIYSCVSSGSSKYSADDFKVESDISDGLASIGSIARFHSSRKFGFIRSKDGQEYFFHSSGVLDSDLLMDGEGLMVRFNLTIDYLGRPVAIDVCKASG